MEDIYSTTITLVDAMNAFLILISCIFIFVIVSMFRDKKLRSLVRSAHFFNIKTVISAWTLIGSAVLLFAIVEVIYSFEIVTDMRAYKLFRTIFGIFLAAGLFIQARFLLRYIKQLEVEKKLKKKKKGKKQKEQ